MKFEDKLKKQQHDLLWQEYCGFLDLDINEYMQIQNRLMEEQIQLWSDSGLGQKLLKGKRPQTIEDFRRMLPLTDFSDYADVLLNKRCDMLPGEPVVWIQTTWEGGKHPIKLAPYTKEMLDIYKNNVMASLMLCTSNRRGYFSVRPKDRTLYGFAPLPYVTGLFPVVFNEEITLEYLPPLAESNKMSFGERNKVGFSLGARRGIDLFFGMGSIVSYMTENFSSAVGGQRSTKIHLKDFSLTMLVRYLKSSYKSKRDSRPLLPKDIFRLKGFVCAGTDTGYYKDFLEESWGICPMQIAAGTETTIIGTETWNRNGLVFFPDACFYEFIPEAEMLKNIKNPSYIPKTCLMDEISANQNYELVITVLKGGVFARYRIGDVYRCLSTGNEKDGIKLPLLTFMDRIPSVIDIAGFTRITENSIKDIIELSGLKINEWVAAKEYNEAHRPYLHMYVEMSQEAVESSALSKQILTEHLSVYFKYFDADYNDLKRLLGIDPLVITILRTGTMRTYRQAGNTIRRINPSNLQIAELLQAQGRINDIPDYVSRDPDPIAEGGDSRTW